MPLKIRFLFHDFGYGISTHEGLRYVANDRSLFFVLSSIIYFWCYLILNERYVLISLMLFC